MCIFHFASATPHPGDGVQPVASPRRRIERRDRGGTAGLSAATDVPTLFMRLGASVAGLVGVSATHCLQGRARPMPLRRSFILSPASL